MKIKVIFDLYLQIFPCRHRTGTYYHDGKLVDVGAIPNQCNTDVNHDWFFHLVLESVIQKTFQDVRIFLDQAAQKIVVEDHFVLRDFYLRVAPVFHAFDM